MTDIQRNPTRSVRIGQTHIGAQHPIAVQSMAATRTQDIKATLRQIKVIGEAGADIIRVAVDSRKDVDALGEICLLYTSPSPRDATLSRMPSSA